MKKAMRKFVSVVLMVTMIVGLLSGYCVHAETTICDESYDGKNVGAQDYSTWSSPIESYLVANSDGTFMRVQYGSEIGGVLVEYYDKDYNLMSHKLIAEELSIFGGFYTNGSNYYIVTGQLNTEESNTKEVYRITKYDKNWNRIMSVGLKNCNTTRPFWAGSCRMDASGDYLVIRTSHEMYKDPDDGYNYQSNMTIQVKMSTMEITDSFTKILTNEYGHVSHSFNQFIKIENNKIVSVDHGDTYPRSIVLINYKTDITTGHFVPTSSSKCSATEVLKFKGEPGDNTTGASVGGFESSGLKYLIAGNTVVQDDNYATRKTRNVFVTTVDKSTLAVDTKFLTFYDEGEETTTTPQLVKISDTKFMVLWTSGENVYYTLVDGNGNKIDGTYSFKGNLSDCAPIVSNGKVVWYTWLNNVLTFYDVDVNNLSDNNTTVITNGHDYQLMGTGKNTIDLKCDKCGKQVTEKTATLGDIWWKPEGSNISYSNLVPQQSLGQVFHCTIEYSPSDANKEMEVISSDENIISVEMTDYTEAKVTMKNIGTATITVRPKYNLSNERKYTVTVIAPFEFKSFETNKTSAVYGDTVELSVNATGGEGTFQYKFYEMNNEGKKTVISDFSTKSTCTWKPAGAGTRTLYAQVKDGTGAIITKSIEDFVVEKGTCEIVENPQISAIVYGQSLGDAKIQGGLVEALGKTIQGTFYFENENIKPSVKEGKTNEYKLIFKPNDIENYNVSNIMVKVDVNPAEYAPNQPQSKMNVKNSLECVGEIELPDGWSWEDGSTPLIVEQVVKATAVYKDADNYKVSSVEVDIYRSLCEHQESDLIVDNASTCLQERVAHTECLVCGEVLRTNIIIPMAEHKYGQYVSDGNEKHTATCEVCGATKTEQHTWNKVAEKEVSGKLVTTYKCNVCGGVKETSKTINQPKPGDSGQNNNGQSNGGQGNGSTNTLKKNISVKANGVTYKVTKAGKSGVAEVGVTKAGANVKSYIVPDYVVIDGIRCKVTSITAKAFYKNKNLKKITIGRNITTIGSKAFYGCKKLKTITVNSTVLKKVGKKSIKGIKKNAKIKVPKKKRKTYKKLFGKKSGYKKTMKMK